MRRTIIGILLDQLLSSMKNRSVLCWQGSSPDETYSDLYDCACCITWVGGDPKEIVASSDHILNVCGCICHSRIEEMSKAPNMKLLLLASKAMGIFPDVPSSYEDNMSKIRANMHLPGCECEDCGLLAKQIAKFDEHNSKEHCTCFSCVEVRTAEPNRMLQLLKKLDKKKKKNSGSKKVKK